jgi:excinuclease ABC subunit C
MKTYSKNLEFEKAQKSKQLIQHLENARITQTLMTAKNSNVDVIGVNIGQYDVVLSCLIIRNGRIVGEVKNTFEPLNLDEIDSYMPQIILSLFDKNTPSNEILVSHNISEISSLKTLLEDKWQKEIKVNYPKKGWKKDLLDTALEDAQELRRISDLKRRSDLEFRSLSLEQLKSKLNLKEIPYRIEAYDISNLGDKFRVGSMVVFEDGISKPSMYRRFHIKTFEGQDDFRSMEEIVFRRIKRLRKEKEVDQSFRRKPNLILIDGGKGQLGKAKSVLDHFELDIDVIGLAKKEEEVFLPTSKKSVILNKNSEALFVLQNIRDEAHRFAITENKRLRVRELDLIDVLSIKGVSQSSIENLFNTHKTLNKISKLSINKLSEIVSEQEAEKIYNYFNN